MRGRYTDIPIYDNLKVKVFVKIRFKCFLVLAPIPQKTLSKRRKRKKGQFNSENAIEAAPNSLAISLCGSQLCIDDNK